MNCRAVISCTMWTKCIVFNIKAVGTQWCRRGLRASRRVVGFLGKEKPPSVQNNKMHWGFLRTGFRSCDIMRFSLSLLYLRVTSPIITGGSRPIFNATGGTYSYHFIQRAATVDVACC